MSKQIFTLLFMSTLGFISYGQSKNVSKEILFKGASSFDTSVIQIFEYTNQYVLFKNNKRTDLTGDDLLKIEAVLNNCITEYNQKQEKVFDRLNKMHPEYKLNKQSYLIHLANYKRQYVATVNSKGEKEVWLNCVCENYKFNWRSEIIMVQDGGNCFFNLKMNLSTGKFYELIVNGEA